MCSVAILAQAILIEAGRSFAEMAGVECESEFLEVAGAGSAEFNGTYSKKVAVEDMKVFRTLLQHVNNSRQFAPAAIPAAEIWHKREKGQKMYVIIRNFYDSGTMGLVSWSLLKHEIFGYFSHFYVGEFTAGGDNQDLADIAWMKKSSDAEDPLPTLRRATHRKRKAEDPSGIMENLWKQRRFTDAEVHCNGTRFQVHRSMLVAASPVFEAAFSSVMLEGASAVYEITESTPEAVEAMLCSVYTGELPPAELISSFFELAVRYELKALAKEAAGMMPGCLSVGNIKEILKVLHLYSDTCASAKEALEHVISRVKNARTHDLFMAAALE